MRNYAHRQEVCAAHHGPLTVPDVVRFAECCASLTEEELKHRFYAFAGLVGGFGEPIAFHQVHAALESSGLDWEVESVSEPRQGRRVLIFDRFGIGAVGVELVWDRKLNQVRLAIVGNVAEAVQDSAAKAKAA